jgi:VanZ family protein
MTESALPSGDRFSGLYLTLAVAWAGVLAWLLLSEPGDLNLIRTPDFVLNLGHALVFAPLGALLFLGFPKCHAFLLLAFVLAGVYGALMEMLQLWVPGRICDPIDAMTNVFGAAWGISCVVALGHWREKGLGNARLLRLPLLLLLASLGSALLATLA